MSALMEKSFILSTPIYHINRSFLARELKIPENENTDKMYTLTLIAAKLQHNKITEQDLLYQSMHVNPRALVLTRSPLMYSIVAMLQQGGMQGVGVDNSHEVAPPHTLDTSPETTSSHNPTTHYPNDAPRPLFFKSES